MRRIMFFRSVALHKPLTFFTLLILVNLGVMLISSPTTLASSHTSMSKRTSVNLLINPTKTSTTTINNPHFSADCPSSTDYIVVANSDVNGLQAAAQLASGCSSIQYPVTIYLAGGTYNLTSTLAFTVSGAVDSIIIQGNDSILEGTNIELMSVNGTMEIHHLIFQYGNPSQSTPVFGGAIGGRGTLIIRDSQFQSNNAPYGGAISFGGYWNLERVKFNNNSNISGGTGGALLVNYALKDANGNSSQIRCTSFTGNNSTNGGAIYSPIYTGDGSVLNLNYNTFTNNAARYGADIYWNAADNLIDPSHNYWTAATPQIMTGDGNPLTTNPLLSTNPITPVGSTYSPTDCAPVPVVTIPPVTATPTNTATVTLTASSTYTPTPIPGPIDTIGVYHNGIFNLRLQNSAGSPDISVPFIAGTQPYPIVGDWTGTGYDTIGIDDRATGNFTLCPANNSSYCANPANLITFTLGNTNDTPLSGRWVIGASHAGAGIFRPGNGVIYLKNTLMTGYADYAMVLGLPGDKGIAGDWTGKGFDSPGVYRPTTANFYLSNVVTNGPVFADITFAFGLSSDLPIAGDWIGQGHDGVGMFRSGNSTFLLKNVLVAGYADNSFGFGASGDIPVAGLWQPADLVPTATSSVTPTPSPTIGVCLARTPTPTGGVPGGVVTPIVEDASTTPCVNTPGPSPTATQFTSCPWNGTPNFNGGTLTTCTYLYSYNSMARWRALSYALKYAQHANSLFCKFKYYGTSSNCAGPKYTDCANFVSQSILSGGVITVSTANPNTSQEELKWYVTFNTSNGVYEHDTNDSAWDGADTNQMPLHFLELNGIQVGAGNVSLNTIVAPQAIFNTVTPPVPTANSIAQTQVAEVESVDYIAVQSAGIEQGDILYLNNAIYTDPITKKPADGAHTVLIAGWGAPLTSWADYVKAEPLLAQGTSVPGGGPNGSGIWPTYSSAQTTGGISNPVPYIIDHGPAGDAAANPTGTSIFVYPRPYYMLWWPPPSNPNNNVFSNMLYYSNKIAGNIIFLHINDTLTFSANPPLTPPYTSTYVLYPPTGLDPTQLFNGQH